jgi:hypothetical protein
MNNPTIFKIEYQGRETVIIPVTASDEVDSGCFSGAWNEIDMAPGTGYVSDQPNNEGGNKSHTTSVQFFIAGISTEQKMELNELESDPAVYRLTDGEGKQYIVGSDQFRARLTFGEEISAAASGKKGYNCSISCKSPYGLLIYEESGS